MRGGKARPGAGRSLWEHWVDFMAGSFVACAALRETLRDSSQISWQREHPCRMGNKGYHALPGALFVVKGENIFLAQYFSEQTETEEGKKKAENSIPF